MKPYFNFHQINELRKCYQGFPQYNNLDFADKIKFIADNSLSGRDMRELRVHFLKNYYVTIQDVKKYFSIDKGDGPFSLEQIQELSVPYSCENRCLSTREFQFIFNPLFTPKMMDFLSRCFVFYDIKLNQIQNLFTEETLPKKFLSFQKILKTNLKL